MTTMWSRISDREDYAGGTVVSTTSSWRLRHRRHGDAGAKRPARGAVPRDGRSTTSIERRRAAAALPPVPAGAFREIRSLDDAGGVTRRVRAVLDHEHVSNAERSRIATRFNPRAQAVRK